MRACQARLSQHYQVVMPNTAVALSVLFLSTMNIKVLQKLSVELNAGRPISVLLRLNRWLDKSDPIRTALANDARAIIQRSKRYQALAPLWERICRGDCFEELTIAEQASAQTIEARADRSEKTVPSFPLSRRSSARRATVLRGAPRFTARFTRSALGARHRSYQMPHSNLKMP
jgi:hypothetical protein